MTGTSRPLVVDLDQTLVGVDTLRLLRQRLAVHRPWRSRERTRRFGLGKQHEKLWLWREVPLATTLLPINGALVERVRGCAGARHLVLATGSSHELADAINSGLGDLFDEVIGTDEDVNLTGPRKAARLEERFGHLGFDYVGDSEADIPVWERAAHAYVCTDDVTLLGSVRALRPDAVLAPRRATTRAERLRLVAAKVVR